MTRLARLVALDTAHRTYYERAAFRAGACLGIVLGILAGWTVAGLIVFIIVGWRIWT